MIWWRSEPLAIVIHLRFEILTNVAALKRKQNQSLVNDQEELEGMYSATRMSRRLGTPNLLTSAVSEPAISILCLGF